METEMTESFDVNDHETWDELVRLGHVAPPSPSVLQDAVTAVRDAAHRQPIPSGTRSTGRWWQRRHAPRWVLATSAATLGTAVVVLAAWGIVGGSTSAEPPASLVGAPASTATHTPSAMSDPTPGGTVIQGAGPVGGDDMASCAFGYSAQTLAERAFAFDGVVIAIGPAGGSGYPLQDSVVTFAVNHWYRGGSAAEVSLDMWQPATWPVQPDSEWGPSYGIGTRMLVSGEPRWGGEPLDDPVVWSCGFTRYYDESTAALWASVFE